jgi:hypothetical protein
MLDAVKPYHEEWTEGGLKKYATINTKGFSRGASKFTDSRAPASATRQGFEAVPELHEWMTTRLEGDDVRT